jgi:hypothetical protein
MALSFLCAGCSQGERDEAEATVKAALGGRFQHDSWAVSLVRVGPTWSVTIDGPGFRALSFVAPAQHLGESLVEHLASPAPSAPGAHADPRAATPAAPQVKAGAKLVRDRQECHKCHRAFMVAYELEADEAQDTVSVACPYCWQMNQVLVGESAAYTEAFKAERLET